MNHFRAYELTELVIELVSLKWNYYNFSKRSAAGAKPRHKEGRNPLLRNLIRLRTLFQATGFTEVVEQIEFALAGLRGEPDYSTIEVELTYVLIKITQALERRAFLFVSNDRAEYLDQKMLFGKRVYDAFPSARGEIREAGNCLAAECPTAAVFHLMRAVEWALRALCAHLGLRKKLIRKNRKTGTVTHVPLTHLDWETMLNQAQSRAKKKFEHLKRGPNKDAYELFYYPMLQDVQAIRDAWRNHVMHTRAVYTREDSLAIFGHVQRFMTTLAERVSEC